MASGPYRAQFGAVYHECDAGFLVTVSPPASAEEVAKALNAEEIRKGILASGGFPEKGCILETQMLKAETIDLLKGDPQRAQHFVRTWFAKNLDTSLKDHGEWLNLARSFMTLLKTSAVDAVDAARYRWLRDDRGYVPEENYARGGEELDALCDKGLADAG